MVKKKSACNVGDPGSIPGSGRSPGEGNGNPLQYSSLKNYIDRGAWWATIQGSQRVRYDWATNTNYVLGPMLNPRDEEMSRPQPYCGYEFNVQQAALPAQGAQWLQWVYRMNPFPAPGTNPDKAVQVIPPHLPPTPKPMRSTFILSKGIHWLRMGL